MAKQPDGPPCPPLPVEVRGWRKDLLPHSSQTFAAFRIDLLQRAHVFILTRRAKVNLRGQLRSPPK